ncbi:sigma-54-dependent Fis family transcriptional regulator [Puniceicoccales bacterium CK1056]|uniref:Sigma-54-dependent Fis family transcriptional regulator n=1 Tax=Oceanipulchritudo coccoides TaxID=2706888 RepID=A0A6B2LZ94_9BACT|nr:sigma-54 dependent transcriptional regulator [Oceanipulchritudo coccoides]NDV61763.1 sigma-54-dependent Fis family transcriptional regulator [Oceanipulchritudo coccoides]
MPATILIVDDEKHTREGLMLALEDEYDVYLATDAEEAFRLMESEPFDVILTDLRMTGKSGMKVIEQAMTLSNKPVIIMMTAYGNVETAVEAMKRGAHDFLTKPLNIEKLEIMIQRALRNRSTEEEVKTLKKRLDDKFSLDGIIGNSSALAGVIDKVRLVAPTRTTVLIEGETGTGKELIAQAIHQNSERANKPFVAVHCAALAANLLESELFGHERGAFTGASERRIGRFEAANNGTLFLDEIGEIDASTQVKLLRFLETRSFERLGSVKPVKVDVRLVAATNRNLAELVKSGDFREDLLYRLNVVTLTMPPLRERQDDIPVLLHHFMKTVAEENGVPLLEVDPDVFRALQTYNWPGNIRELRNFAENTVVMKRGGRLSLYDLDSRFLSPEHEALASSPAAPINNPLSVEENEKRLLRNALVQANGNRTQAAKLLGMSRRTLHRKLKQWPDLDVR